MEINSEIKSNQRMYGTSFPNELNSMGWRALNETLHHSY